MDGAVLMEDGCGLPVFPGCRAPGSGKAVDALEYC